jgi:FkbM family methyltransferase
LSLAHEAAFPDTTATMIASNPKRRSGHARDGAQIRGIVAAVVLALAAGLVAACSDDPARRDILGSETKRYSQLDEELVIRDFFQDRREGVFLDVGCAWPRADNNTYYLEAHLGWSGIAIDALTSYGPDWKKERPKSRFFSYLVSDHANVRESFYRTGPTGLSSTQKNRVFMGRKLDDIEIEVETITLDILLEREGIETVDFVSMDIEEHEPEALAGFDIERWAPELVCVEASPNTRLRLLEYFDAHGYERIERYIEHDQANWYFTPKAR